MNKENVQIASNDIKATIERKEVTNNGTNSSRIDLHSQSDCKS